MRGWLRRNHIYFQTIATTLLSLMAVAVGISQVWVARIQTEIAREQTKLQKAELAPKFAIKEVYVKNPESGVYDNTWLEVSNFGSAVTGVNASVAVFIDVRLRLQDGTRIDHSLPLMGYYISRVPTGNSQGPLIRFEGISNNHAYAEVHRALLDACETDDRIVFSMVGLRKYVEIAYQDISGLPSYAYFIENSNVGGKLINSDYGRQVFIDFNQSASMVDLATLTAQRLIELTIEAHDRGL